MAVYSHAKYLVITNADILPIILSYLDKSSLLSSTLVSHLFNTSATKILYSQVNLKTVKNVDSFINTLNRTEHFYTKEYLVNNIRSIVIDSPNLAYLPGKKLGNCISECKKVKEVIVGQCTLTKSIIVAITRLEELSILKLRSCTVIDSNILDFLISTSEDNSTSATTNTITSTTTFTTITTSTTTNTNKLKDLITKKILHTRHSTTEPTDPTDPTITSSSELPYVSKLTQLTHLTIDIEPSCPPQLLISLIQQNKNIKSLDLHFQGLDESLLTIAQCSSSLEYLTITEKNNLSERTIIQLVANCFSTSIIDTTTSSKSNTLVYCRLKKLLIDYGPFSDKFLLSLSNLCKTQRKISITQQPEIDYRGFDLVFTNDSLEILLNHCEDIGKILLNFNYTVSESDIMTDNNGIEELILDGIKLSADSLSLICEHFNFKILKLQNLPTLSKKDIVNGITLLSNLKCLHVTEKKQYSNRNRLEQLNYNDFEELAQHCPNLVRIYWNHKKFIDKFKIPSKFIQVLE